MKILHVHRTLEPLGGIEIYLRALVEHQRAQGHEVALLLRDDGVAPSPEFEPDVVHVHDATLPPGDLAEFEHGHRVVVSLHNLNFGCSTGHRYFGDGETCGRRHGAGCIPNILFRGCGHRPDPRPALRAYRQVGERLPLLRSAGAVVAHSEFVRSLAVLHGVAPGRARLAPYFVERPASPQPPAEGARVCFVGRIVPEKGLDILLRALARVEGWDSLTVAGDGWQRAQVERLAARLGLAGRVEFAGWGDGEEVEAALRRSRVLAVPSRWPEPFGIVGIQAMAQARAVVGNRVGGIVDWLDDGETGLLVDPGSVERLAVALQRVVASPDLARDLGERGWERVDRFSPEAHLAALDQAYGTAA